MPSPFPGMDPYIESQLWEDFHHAVIEVIREALIPQTRPRYVVREADPDIVLDLQAICTTVYDRAGYDYSLNYRQTIMPPLRDTEQAWAQQILVAITTPPASA